ncbi:MAG: hypothetical protein WBA13_16610 [Microcoleaceae cyanobacterium]
MPVIQVIIQRMMLASCFCLALALYTTPTRTLPVILAEATKLNQAVWRTHQAQQLSTETGNTVKSQSTYLLTRSEEQRCKVNACSLEDKKTKAARKIFNPHLGFPFLIK